MKNIIAAVLCALMLAVSPASAGGTKPASGSAQQNTPYWRVYRSTAQSALGGTSVIAFDTATYDTASSCSLTTGKCRPLTAGLYDIFCQVHVLEVTGPAAGNNAVADVKITLNGVILTDTYIAAQAASVSNAINAVSAHTIVRIAGTNTTADDIACQAGADGTTVSSGAGSSKTYMTGYRIGPQ